MTGLVKRKHPLFTALMALHGLEMERLWVAPNQV